jgi:predicted RecA/RadA family phage recombinase
MKKSLILMVAVAAASLAAFAAHAMGVDVPALIASRPDVAVGLLGAGAALSTNAVQRGDVIDWVNGGSAVGAGDVVRIGKILGVALVDIGAGETGSVAIRGVFTVPKVSAAVIAQGENLTWDASAAAFDDNAATPATGDVTGAPALAFEAAGNGVTEMDVMFTGVPGTVT